MFYTRYFFIDNNKFVFKLLNVNRFHFWNDTIGICQFKRKNMIDWYTNTYGFTPKDEMFYLCK